MITQAFPLFRFLTRSATRDVYFDEKSHNESHACMHQINVVV